ncbi:uncharacterized protein LOC126908525 isoform X2 [Daktulosphaira vitifoliae]|uniref:uncharacterized protein LOC126908525 isoform X2 n=1 Tax=Daktulosphaira vitifoliae TaxID=58002 RepID=UPI0021AAFF3F|nr:uncharacterized protein LOC126908525 isoform X2 [Daktulosphaira vitifoliae]
MILKKIILLLTIHLILGISYNDLKCNFLKYMLNYFNHNNRYLIELIENKEKYDVDSLSKYGNAIKTHGEIVLIMLDVLREADKKFYPKELISVNLYLNNVSGNVEFYAKNDDGIFDLSDKTSSIIKGYKMHHKLLSDHLYIIIAKHCQCAIFDEVFIYIPDYNESGEYTLGNFQIVSNKLRNRLLQSDKHQNDTDEYIKNLTFSRVYFYFKKAIKRCEYWEFLPKNLLFYNFMMNNREISEKDLIRNSQDKQYPQLINGRIQNVLDFIRFAPLAIICPDERHLTLFDIFRYIKYSFYTKDIQVFHVLLMTATFRPIALLVRLLINILRSSIDVYNFYSDEKESLILYHNIIFVGNRIIEIFQDFVNLDLFGDGPSRVFLKLSEITSQCLKYFINKNNTSVKLSSIKLMHSLKSFFYDNKFNFDNIYEYSTKDIINTCFNELTVNMKHTETFLRNLEEHKKLFEVTKKTLNINHKLNLQLTNVFNKYTMNVLCQTKDIYTLLYKFNDEYVTQIVDYDKNITFDDDEKINKYMSYENYPEDYINNDYYYDLHYYPIYLKNYILFI